MSYAYKLIVVKLIRVLSDDTFRFVCTTGIDNYYFVCDFYKRIHRLFYAKFFVLNHKYTDKFIIAFSYFYK